MTTQVDEPNSQSELNSIILALGKSAKSRVGAKDLRSFRRLKRASQVAELVGRASLHFMTGPVLWTFGMLSVAFHLCLESQLNHSVMHGAYEDIPGAEDLNPKKYETLAIPFQSKTWGDAHRVHHAAPSILDKDPDTVHPLFRIHKSQKWRLWHLGNTILGIIFVFECWAFDYNRFLKKLGLRPQNDRGEIRKFSFFLSYQYLLFPLLAGVNWKTVLLGNLCASVVRNFVFIGLQAGSSVGAQVSTIHPYGIAKKDQSSWARFQIETSKNFILPRFWKTICGGLDRHIEHHLYPSLPPNRLYEVSGAIRTQCLKERIEYQEFSSLPASLRDSFGYLFKLSWPSKRAVKGSSR